MCFAERVVVADVAAAKALALRALVPADDGVILFAAVLPELFLSVRSIDA
jgi:hypothetical protein